MIKRFRNYIREIGVFMARIINPGIITGYFDMWIYFNERQVVFGASRLYLTGVDGRTLPEITVFFPEVTAFPRIGPVNRYSGISL